MAETSQAKGEANQARGRRILLALLAIALLPVAIAWTLYLIDWRPQRTGNHGELVQPARPLADLNFSAIDGTPRSLVALRGKWTLVYIGPGSCPESCRATLHQLSQVVLAQGKEMDRVRRVFLAEGAVERAALAKLPDEFAGLEAWTGEARTIEALRAQLAVPGEASGRVYLIDPLGNLMLTYPAGFDASGMRKDLGRLLRVSRVG